MRTDMRAYHYAFRIRTRAHPAAWYSPPLPRFTRVRQPGGDGPAVLPGARWSGLSDGLSAIQCASGRVMIFVRVCTRDIRACLHA